MISTTIVKHLIGNDAYFRKVIPFIKAEYFQDHNEKVVVEEILRFFSSRQVAPNREVLRVEIANRPDLSDKEYKMVEEFVDNLTINEHPDEQWLLDSTEKFCKDRSVYNAIIESIKIIDGKVKDKTEDALPSMLQEALAVCFDQSIGHDYLEDYAKRFDFYHLKEDRLPFDLDILNDITNGGLPRSTLSCILAGTGVGKSIFLCHLAAAAIKQGTDVLYITLEMAEERIAERIDSNLLDVQLNDLHNISQETYYGRMDKLIKKTRGKLIIKEYPTGSAHVGHFRALLQELKLKKKFTPKLILIDYLNICASARVKLGSSINSYTLVKSIAEELRGLAIEFKVPIFTATQTNRDGNNNSDLDLSNTSESFGLPMTLDLFLAMISTEELAEMNQIMFKQLKNRFNDVNYFQRFVLGLDKSRMKFYNLEKSAQDNVHNIVKGGYKKEQEEDVPLFDKSNRDRGRGNFDKFQF